MSNLRKKDKPGTTAIARETNEGGGKGVPLSAAEVAGATGVGLSTTLGCSPKDKFRGSRTPRISRIANVCSSTFCLSYLVCGVLIPLLRVCSVSHSNLELFDMVSEYGWG